MGKPDFRKRHWRGRFSAALVCWRWGQSVGGRGGDAAIRRDTDEPRPRAGAARSRTVRAAQAQRPGLSQQTEAKRAFGAQCRKQLVRRRGDGHALGVDAVVTCFVLLRVDVGALVHVNEQRHVNLNKRPAGTAGIHGASFDTPLRQCCKQHGEQPRGVERGVGVRAHQGGGAWCRSAQGRAGRSLD